MIALRTAAPLAACLALFSAAPVQAQQANMSFFVTSVGAGKGADLGGLAGADKHCQDLAKAAGAGAKTWHAYLSTQGDGAVNARARIGKGPWMNVKGVVVAASVDDLHSAINQLNKQNNLSEQGEVINGRGDTPNRHDILTGSTADGSVPGRQGHDLRGWTAVQGSACSATTTRIGFAMTTPPTRGTRHLSRRGGRCSQTTCAPLVASGCCMLRRQLKSAETFVWPGIPATAVWMTPSVKPERCLMRHQLFTGRNQGRGEFVGWRWMPVRQTTSRVEGGRIIWQ